MKGLIRAAALTLLTWAVVASTGPLVAQSRHTEHTLRLDGATHTTRASLTDVAWLTGSWEGAAFGGRVEEVWAPASGGTMVGLFKLLTDGRPTMYEIAWISEEGGSLTLKLKHFHADFTAWEEKDELISFPLISVSEDAVHFDRLTFRRQGDDGIVAYLALRRDGELL